MKIPKCPKTVTGKHKIEDTSFTSCITVIDQRPADWKIGIPLKGHTKCIKIKGVKKCIYCGLIDDREEQK